MYALARQLLFRLPPETSHHLSLAGLKLAHRAGLLGRGNSDWAWQPVEAMGLRFPNPVGLAAGLDKNGDYFNALGALGFGFVEIGTVTPRPQPGNPKPRLFRLPQRRAIINRMGFNNQGIDHLLEQTAGRAYPGVLGINIGKNFDTPVERAVDDYRLGLQRAYFHADYISVNISSPNTPGLRDLQHSEQLGKLLADLKQCQSELVEQQQRYVPLAVKIAPDLEDSALVELAGQLREAGIDGVIATNTTLAREAVAGVRHGTEQGGLSGVPLRERATEVVAVLAGALADSVPIIAVGGIESGADARAKLAAGARLVQVYTGFIYRGPGLVRELVEALAENRAEGA